MEKGSGNVPSFVQSAEKELAKRATTARARNFLKAAVLITATLAGSPAQAEGKKFELQTGGIPVTGMQNPEQSRGFNTADPLDPENARLLEEMKQDLSFKTLEQRRMMEEMEAEIKRLGGTKDVK